jgi:hypothetical protein
MVRVVLTYGADLLDFHAYNQCAIYYHMDVDSILHIDCKHENLGANDNDLIKTIFVSVNVLILKLVTSLLPPNTINLPPDTFRKHKTEIPHFQFFNSNIVHMYP